MNRSSGHDPFAEEVNTSDALVPNSFWLLLVRHLLLVVMHLLLVLRERVLVFVPCGL